MNDGIGYEIQSQDGTRTLARTGLAETAALIASVHVERELDLPVIRITTHGRTLPGTRVETTIGSTIESIMADLEAETAACDAEELAACTGEGAVLTAPDGTKWTGLRSSSDGSTTVFERQGPLWGSVPLPGRTKIAEVRWEDTRDEEGREMGLGPNWWPTT